MTILTSGLLKAILFFNPLQKYLQNAYHMAGPLLNTGDNSPEKDKYAFCC
jgi:hypothetical protein